MGSLRRAVLSLKLHSSWRIISAKSEIFTTSLRNTAGNCTLEHFTSSGCNLSKELYHTASVGEGFFVGSCSYCSHAGATSEIENDTDALDSNEVDGEELVSELVYLDDAEKGDSISKDPEMEKAALKLLNFIVEARSDAISDVLNKWAEKGNKLSQKGISIIVISLKKFRMYWKALKFSEWLEMSKQVDLTEQYYASRVNLIYNTENLEKAEKFFDKIPESFKGELTYRSLLKSCVGTLNIRKAEAVFKKMRDLELPITVDACNQMMLLYKRMDKKKIADILLTMEKQNIKPSLLTYNLLIDIKGEADDIIGMEQLVEAMKADNIEPDIKALTLLAKHYLSGEFKHKTETIIKEIEEKNIKGIFGARKSLLLLYASIGRADEVGRVWKDCKLDPKMQECLAAIEAWGKLGKVEEAEAAFDVMLQKWKLTSKHYSALLEVYVNNNSLNKGKDLAKQMVVKGLWIGPTACHAIVRLYIEAGNVEKADSILQKAPQQKHMRPLFKTYIGVMEQYAKRGDIHNTEKLFQRIKEFGYIGRLKPFEVLAQAYINAKTPAYGFRDRMRADNVFPHKTFAKQLAQVDAFQRTVIPDLLD